MYQGLSEALQVLADACKVSRECRRLGNKEGLPRMWEGKGTLAVIREERRLVAPGWKEETDPFPHSSRGK